MAEPNGVTRSTRLALEMDAAGWTVIGLLAETSLGNLFYLGFRIDALAGRMDARFDARRLSVRVLSRWSG